MWDNPAGYLIQCQQVKTHCKQSTEPMTTESCTSEPAKLSDGTEPETTKPVATEPVTPKPGHRHKPGFRPGEKRYVACLRHKVSGK